MDEMKLLEDFCAAEPDPHPSWLTRARSDLTARTGASRHRHRPWVRGWLTPLAAAAAVVAAATVPLAVVHGPGPKPPTAAPSGPGGTPRYFAAASANGHYVVIGATATGKTLATVHLPTDGGSYVCDATADDRTFLLQNWPTHGATFTPVSYLARFHPQSRTVSLTELPFHLKLYYGAYHEQSLSPDGTMVAVTQYSILTAHILAVTIFNVATGTSRTWTRPYPFNPNSLDTAWSANGRQLEITWQDNKPLEQYTIRLNIATPGTHLPAPQTMALPVSFGSNIFDQGIAPDGDVFFIVFSDVSKTWVLEEYSAATHQFSRLLGPVHRGNDRTVVGWASNNRDILIIVNSVNDLGFSNNFGFFAHGRYTPLPPTALMSEPDNTIAW